MLGLNIKITGSALTVNKMEEITTSGTNQFTCIVERDEEWKAMETHIIFNEQPIIVGPENEIVIPNEQVDKESITIFAVGVSGKATFTTNGVVVKTVKSLSLETLSIETPTIWEQYVLIISDIAKEAELKAQKALFENLKGVGYTGTENELYIKLVELLQ